MRKRKNTALKIAIASLMLLVLIIG